MRGVADIFDEVRLIAATSSFWNELCVYGAPRATSGRRIVLVDDVIRAADTSTSATVLLAGH
jgi:adenine/guanine phosphoribosyltransferase-like PRPP-binding protein